MTYEQQNQINGLILIGVILLLYFLRNTPLGFLWKGIRFFLIVLLLTLSADLIKDKIKEWWIK